MKPIILGKTFAAGRGSFLHLALRPHPIALALAAIWLLLLALGLFRAIALALQEPTPLIPLLGGAIVLLSITALLTFLPYLAYLYIFDRESNRARLFFANLINSHPTEELPPMLESGAA